MSQFLKKTIKITKGAGSCGNAVLDRLLTTDMGEFCFL